MTVYAHKLVATIAQQMAGALYDECAKINEWYALNPSRRNFVRRVAPDLVEQAKAQLVDMLARPEVPDSEKNTIYDALLKNAALPKNTARTTTH